MGDTAPLAVQAAHELRLWIIPKIDQFQRGRRYTPGGEFDRVAASPSWAVMPIRWVAHPKRASSHVQ